ncbi:MAG: hypothetical protein HY678_12045 [Chloroflexi bacterium]|nr:hypothetical protein [Chloroflexota bacterium]
MTGSFSAWASSSASLAMLPGPLANDLRQSIEAGRRAGAVFVVNGDAEAIYRSAVDEAITSLEFRHRLLVDFLVKGPYYDGGRIPADKRADHVTDEECAKAIRFVFGGVVNAFKGRLAELLAVGPCVHLIGDCMATGLIPDGARLYVGDTVRVAGVTRDALRKAADMHVVSVHGQSVTAHGVVEVKSYSIAADRIRTQLGRHVSRLRRGFVVSGRSSPRGDVDQIPVKVWAVPASWKLSRRFEFRPSDGGGSTLMVDESLPVVSVEVTSDADGVSRIKLGWSEEALAAAAHELSFWYMEKLGERAFSQRKSPWPEMTHAEAGRNAAKQSLYYAILRVRGRDEQKAIALYNSYGFGYALGSNFKDQYGRRAMLWPEDLKEIAAAGVTKTGSRIV